MMNLKTLSEKRYGIIPNLLVGAILVVAFIGFLDATYLTAKRFTGSPLTCYFFGGCEKVNASPYSLIFGVPLSLYGSLFYLAVVLSAVAYLQKKQVIVAKLLMGLTTAGFLMSMYFFYLQAFVIGAYCFYCVVSIFTSSTNFILMLVAWKKYFTKTPPVSPPASYIA